jgi:hypothetical protein
MAQNVKQQSAHCKYRGGRAAAKALVRESSLARTPIVATRMMCPLLSFAIHSLSTLALFEMSYSLALDIDASY